MFSALQLRAGTGVLVVLVFCAALFFPPGVSAQLQPSYSFVGFEKGYETILSAGRAEGFQVKEEEISSQYGKYFLLLEKIQTFYTERIYLFFSENKALVSFTVEYSVETGQSWTILDRLISSITERLVEKYGPSENELYPYFRSVEGEYELFVKPHQSFSPSARVTFRHLGRVSQYETYYQQEVERLEQQAIDSTVEKY
jgi:hypothetical protein